MTSGKIRNNINGALWENFCKNAKMPQVYVDEIFVESPRVGSWPSAFVNLKIVSISFDHITLFLTSSRPEGVCEDKTLSLEPMILCGWDSRPLFSALPFLLEMYNISFISSFRYQEKVTLTVHPRLELLNMDIYSLSLYLLWDLR